MFKKYPDSIGDTAREVLDHLPIFRMIAAIVTAVLIPLVILIFAAGRIYGGLERFSDIEPSDLKKAIQYSVVEQEARKDHYREWMKDVELSSAREKVRVDIVVETQNQFKADIRDIKRSIINIDSVISQWKNRKGGPL